ncbi:MazG-like family protein [Actinoallomurus iriomotensis]|uniref:Uncharacterized protein n=1 Tax=Actinoallomurus iriomotensis TaxID=478107 RepID=A0A9W6W5Q8_9ACTN|nr:MazG-like family protein [Actinoallomurus iriomotensis]GLY90291.1 hypothetical protein Airi02_082200 [Actinoallomurus iriomotensis]
MTGLQELAAAIAVRLREHFPDTDLAQQQMLCLAEEAGEFAGAYRRWAGMARRTGSWDDVTAELADVVVTAYVAANVLGLADGLEAARRPAGEPAGHDVLRQIRALFCAAADVVAAFDRGDGDGPPLATRLAGVVDLGAETARVLGIDLDEAVRAKTAVIMTRGWRDDPAETAG